MNEQLPMSWADFRGQAGQLYDGHAGILGEFGVVIESLAEDGLRIRLPKNPATVGDPEWQVVHSGLLMIMLDTVCGLATIQKLVEPAPIATLDLRVDYLRAVPASQDVLVTGQCYKLGRNVGFAKGIAYTDNPEEPAAIANGTFMLGTAGDTPPMAAALKAAGR